MATQTQYRDVKTAVATVFQSISPEQAIFRKEGEYWAIGYGRKSFRLKDTKGLGYLAHLLRHPAAEFHVLDLAGGIAGQHHDDETRQSAHCLQTHALAPAKAWNKIVDEFLTTVKAGRVADGVLADIEACGAILKEHHPASNAS